MKQTGITKLLKSFKNPTTLRNYTKSFGNFSTVIQYIVLLALCGFCLQGCEDIFKPTINDICDEKSELCLDLNLDARCRFERADIIRIRYEHQNDTSDAYKYPLMLAFEEYLVCVEEAQLIEHIKYKGKEATRLKGVLTANRELRRLAKETKTSPDPYLSYYHWAKFNDKDARDRFEHYANSHAVENPALLVLLASIQIKYDNNITTQTLYRALAMYSGSSDVDLSILHSLVSIALDDEKYRMAYVWLGVTETFDDNIPSLKREMLGEEHNLPVDILDDIIDDVVWSIRRGRFDADELKLNRL